MNRLDTIISDVAYILDTLRTFKNIYDSGDCNRCARKNECEYAPKAGQLVRYNCPFYLKKHSTQETDFISSKQAERMLQEEFVDDLLKDLGGRK